MLLVPVLLPRLGVVLAAPGHFGASDGQPSGVEDGGGRSQTDTDVQRDQLEICASISFIFLQDKKKATVT